MQSNVLFFLWPNSPLFPQNGHIGVSCRRHRECAVGASRLTSSILDSLMASSLWEGSRTFGFRRGAGLPQFFRREKTRPKWQVAAVLRRLCNNEILHIEVYGAPLLLLCSDCVPPRVLSGVLCQRPRLRRSRVLRGQPRQVSVDPCCYSATCPHVRKSPFFFLDARLALPVRQT